MKTNVEKAKEKAAKLVFGKRLTQSVERKGITWTELAEKTGIPKSAMTAYKDGKYRPKQLYAYKIAECLDVDPGWLLALDIEENFGETRVGRKSLELDDYLIRKLSSLPDDRLQFIAYFLTLPDNQAQRVMDFAAGLQAAERA